MGARDESAMMTNYKDLDNLPEEKKEKPVKRGRGRPKGSKSMKPHKQGKMTIQKKKKILELMKKNGGNKGAASAAVGVSPSTVIYHEKIDPVFREKMLLAKLEACQEVDEEIRRRGVEGWEEPVYYKGEEVGAIRKYSDNLLMERARAIDPERYGKKTQMEISGNVTVEHKARAKLANMLGIDIEDVEYEDITEQENGAN